VPGQSNTGRPGRRSWRSLVDARAASGAVVKSAWRDHGATRQLQVAQRRSEAIIRLIGFDCRWYAAAVIVTVRVVCLVRASCMCIYSAKLDCLVSVGADLVCPVPNRHQTAQVHLPSQQVTAGSGAVYHLCGMHCWCQSVMWIFDETPNFPQNLPIFGVNRVGRPASILVQEFNLIACLLV